MKKKGFTLIELLAVIVILAIVMVIAIPQILNVIEKSEMESYRESVELMMHTAEIQYNSDEVQGIAKAIPEEGFIYEYTVDGKDTIQTQESIDTYGYLNFKGDKPRSGSITMTKNKKFIVDKLMSKMHNGKYCAIKNLGEQKVRVGKSSDINFNCVAGGDEIVVDNDPCELEVDSSNSNILYVSSVGDLYKLSDVVNKGTNYSGKTIKLRTNLDMSESLPNTNKCKDLVFEPIGTETKPFKGNFEGEAKTISNLTMDKSSSNYVGLFGNINNGSVRGLAIKNFNIKGSSFVGGLVGNLTDGHIYEIIEDNVNVQGSYAVGGTVGEQSATSTKSYVDNIVVKNSSVTSRQPVAGVVAHVNNQGNVENKNLIVYNTNVNNTGNQNDGGIISSGGGWGKYSDSYWSNNSIYSGNTLTDGYNISNHNDINFYEAAGLDTWIGGDNNSSGYYFDYNSSGEIVIKSISKDSIPTNIDSVLKKSNGKYLIESERDWKNATVFVTGNKHFKVINNLNFERNKFYMMGSSQNIFTGTFEGGAKTISNVTINASKTNAIGIFGKVSNNSLIKGFSINNIVVTGSYYTGGLVGYLSNSEILEVLVDNVNINGYYATGGMAGGTYDTSTVSNIIVKNGSVTSSSTPAGGEIGHSPNSDSYTNQNIIVENINLNVSSGNYIDAGIVAPGGGWGKYDRGYFSDKSKHNGNVDGGYFPQSNINDINFYENAGLDTWIGGDNNSSGYYFDYDGNLNINVILKSTEQDPIPTNIDSVLTKSGDYYKIGDAKDWKNASVFVKNNKKFKLTNDINFNNGKFYSLGSEFNTFTGEFDGGAKTISNVTIRANNVNYIGMFGNVLNSRIYGLNIKNITMTGSYFVGGLVGYSNNSTIFEICGDVLNMTGYYATGGIIGCAYPSSNISNILVKKGTIYGSRIPAGGEVGNSATGSSLVNDKIIVEDITLTAASGNYQDAGIVAPGGGWGQYSNGYFSNKSTHNGGSDGGFDSSYIDDLDYYTNKIETKFNGDTNNTGYYFDYVYSKGGVYVVDKNDTTNKPPYTPTSEDDSTASSGGCRISYGSWQHNCYLYSSGVHGGYQYAAITDTSTIPGGSCTSTPGRNPAKRRKINYICN